MRENTTRALIAALVLLVSSTATSTEAAGKAVKRPPRCGNTHVCRHRPKSHLAPLPPDYAQWSRVAQCEESGWNDAGGAYPDAIGVSYANYVAFGGRPLPAGRATRAEIIAQIKVADRLIAYYHVGIPDQSGCAAW